MFIGFNDFKKENRKIILINFYINHFIVLDDFNNEILNLLYKNYHLFYYDEFINFYNKIYFNNIELWLDIKNYEGLYKISNFGNIINCRYYPTIKKMKLSLGKNGYYKISLVDKKNQSKTFTVHKLLIDNFIDNPLNLPCINHKDENRLKNVIDNLERCDHKYNSNYGTCIEKHTIKRSKSIESYNLIDNKTIKKFKSINDASRITGLSISHISQVCNKKRLSTGGVGWRFI